MDEKVKLIYKEDLEAYQTIFDNYESLTSDDLETAYMLAKMSIIQADRWNEIAFNAEKVNRELGVSKTSLYNWAYHRYRILMTIHESCRVVWRQCKEDFRNRGGDFFGE